MQSIIKAAPKLPFRELDFLVKAIGECKSKAEEDRIISAEVDTLKQRLSDPRLDKSRGREYMVRVIYCEMLGHDASFAYIPALQLASDPNLLTKKAAYLALTQLLDYKHELVLLLVNTLLSDLKSDNFVIVASALVVTTKLIGPELINAVLPLVTERLGHPRESVRKKAVMALHHFYQMDPDRSGQLAGVELERLLRTALCDKEPSVMATTLNALQSMAAANPASFRQLIPSLTSILKQVVEHRLPKAYDYHRFPAPFIQIKLLKLLRLLGTGDKAASDNMAAVVGLALRRAAAGGSHTIGHAIVYEAVRTITEIYPNPQLLASAAEAVAGLIKSSSHNLKYCGLTALAAITRVSPKYAQEHQVAVIDCLEDPDDTLKLKTLELLVTMTKSNNVQVVVERLMSFLRSSSCAADELLRRRVAGQVADLAEKYAPDITWFIKVMAEVFEVAGEVLQPQLAHNLCRLIAEQDSELHSTAVKMFLSILDHGTTAAAAPAIGAAPTIAAGSNGASSSSSGVLPEILLNSICWVLGEYGSLATDLPRPWQASPQQVIDKLCVAVVSAQGGPVTRAYLLTAVTKLAAAAQQQQGAAAAAAVTPEAQELLIKCGSSSVVELQQRAQEARALLKLPPPVLSAVLPLDGSCEEFEQSELEDTKNLTFLEGFVNEAIAAGAQPYNPPPELVSGLLDDDDLESLGLPGALSSLAHSSKQAHALRFNAYERAQAPTAATVASGAGSAFGSSSFAPAEGGGTATVAAAGQISGSTGAAPAVSQQQQQPTLKGANRGRWGPTEFTSSSAAAGPGASATPAQAASGAAGSSSKSSNPSNAALTTKLRSEKDKLAASLFGAGDIAEGASSSSSSSRFGVRSPSPNKPAAASPSKTVAAAAAAAAAAAPLVDLLGDDLDPPAPRSPAAGASGSVSNKAADPMDLLMDMTPLDAPDPTAAAATAFPAAGVPTGLDLLADLEPSPAAVTPAAHGSNGVSTAAATVRPLLDLDRLFDSPPAPVVLPGGEAAVAAGGFGMMGQPLLMQQQQQVGIMGVLPQQQQQQQQQPDSAGGAMRPAVGAPMRGGAPLKNAATALVNDPFKDLLG